jgi:hypothetical protein
VSHLIDHASALTPLCGAALDGTPQTRRTGPPCATLRQDPGTPRGTGTTRTAQLSTGDPNQPSAGHRPKENGPGRLSTCDPQRKVTTTWRAAA